MTDTDLERRLRAMVADTSEHRIDTGRGWREFQSLRARATANRRRQLVAAAVAAAAAAVAVAVPILTGGVSAGRPGPGPFTRPHSSSTSFATYPGAVVDRIGLGGVVDMAQDGTRLLAVTGRPQGGNMSFDLVGVDLRTGRAIYRVSLGSTVSSVAAGDGRAWLTTPSGRARGQIMVIDPRSGFVAGRLHLAAGHCGRVTFTGGQLWAECGSGRWNSVFFRLDPATGRVEEMLGPVRGPIGGDIAIAPQGVWYTNYSGASGIVTGNRVAPGPRVITVRDNTYPVSFAYTQSLVYSEGAVWALTNDESVAKIDPATGQVERVYSAVRNDPTGAGGLDFLAAGQGSLWFLDDGFPFSGVLRVSMSTGRPLGGVTIKSGSCGEPCYQIYDTNGTIWVPTSTELIAIDPARLPA